MSPTGHAPHWRWPSAVQIFRPSRTFRSRANCFTAADLRDALSHATGNRWRINRFPWWLMTACSPVWELAREFREMRTFFEMDHWIDGACFAKALPDFRQSPREEVMLAGLPADIHPDQAVRTGRQTVITQ